MEKQENKTSALLIIGNEILSGRTLDQNTQYIGHKMGVHGVPLSEARVVPDVEGTIVETLNDMRARFDFVFTTGGIGPTHDDITAASVAAAFGVGFGRHAGAYDILLEHYGEADLTEARATMADMPVSDDFELILNPVSSAPGFRIGNVFVMAGVPKIMQGMLDHVLEMITPGQALLSDNITIDAPESEIAKILGDVQKQFTDIDLGSYPQFRPDGGWAVNVVARGLDMVRIEECLSVLGARLKEEGISFETGKNS